jgi:glycosyltransferase involved in cell wall biosynthesis
MPKANPQTIPDTQAVQAKIQTKTQPKRLLMISTDRNIFVRGSEVSLRQIEYAKQWQEVHIIVLATKTNELAKESVLSDNCWVYSTHSVFKIKTFLDAISLGKLICRGRSITDITCQDPFFAGMIGLSLKKDFDINLELQVHTDIGSPNFTYIFSNKIRKMMALLYLPKADKIRVVSQRIKTYLINTLKISESKITVKPIFVDIEKIKNTPVSIDLHRKYPQFSKIIMMASRLELEKNIELAINAWSIIAKRYSGWGLVIVGKGSQLNKLRVLVKDSKLEGQVIFEDWADYPTLISYYKTADLFLNTSLYEGYGMSLVEANACNAKIVTTDVGVAGDIGAHIVKWDRKDVAEKIMEVLGNV